MPLAAQASFACGGAAASYAKDTALLPVRIGTTGSGSITKNSLLAAPGLAIPCELRTKGRAVKALKVKSFRYAFLRNGQTIRSGSIVGSAWDNDFKKLAFNAMNDDQLLIDRIALAPVAGATLPRHVIRELRLQIKSNDPKFDEFTTKLLDSIQRLSEFRKLGQLFENDIKKGRSIFSFRPYYEKDSSIVAKRYQVYEYQTNPAYDWTFRISRARNGYIIQDNRLNRTITMKEWQAIVSKIR